MQMMPNMRILYLALLVCAGLPILHGCAAAGVGAVASGASVAHDRRTTGTVIEDQAIELKAIKAIAGNRPLSDQVHINVTSYNKIVLISGEAPTEAMRNQVENLIRPIAEVRLVHNEVAIAAPSSLMTRTSDSLITGRVKAQMLAEDGLDPTRIKVVTENGTVYLMGLVDHATAELATRVTQRISGAQKIVKLFEYTD